MPATVTATLLGTFSSVTRNAHSSTAGVTSLDVVTIAHALSACPNRIIPVLRSSITGASTAGAFIAVQSWNASQAILVQQIGPGGGAMEQLFDVYTEVIFSENL